MGVAQTITVLFWVAVAVLAVGLWRRSRMWAVGRADPHASWAGLLTIPKRYFVDLHHVVAREPAVARAHVAVAGGAVAALLLVGVNYGLQIYSSMLERAILIASGVMLLGAIAVALRRLTPPERLSLGSWNRLPYSLIAFAIGLGTLMLLPTDQAASGLALAALALLTIGSAELALGIGSGGPMKHAVAGLLHLGLHPRPERFSGTRSTDLRPLDLTSESFGVAKTNAFRWTQLLSFDACVQCGKCEAACPAFAAEQPLSPKKLIQDLVAGLSSGNDSAYAGSPTPGIALGQHGGAPGHPIVPNLIESETLWSCTTCRACVEECPMMIEHVDAIVDMRRHLNLERGEAAGKASETLTNLRETETQGGLSNAERYSWAIDLDVKVAMPATPVDILLIAGEGAFDMRYQRTLRALVKVLKAAGVDFAVLGGLERDTGDIARRLGDEATFQTLAKRTIKTLATLSFQRIVTPDPHVLHSLKNEYRALGGSYLVFHHTTVLAELVRNGRLRLKPSPETRAVTYHDPCYLGRYNGEFEAPRTLLAALGLDIKTMERSGPRARCCGGGGGAPLTDIPGQRRIPDMRMNDIRETGAGIVAVGCPQCTAMLEGVTGERPEVLDVAELVARAIEVPL
jgi:dimethylglycine catabolism B